MRRVIFIVEIGQPLLMSLEVACQTAEIFIEIGRWQEPVSFEGGEVTKIAMLQFNSLARWLVAG